MSSAHPPVGVPPHRPADSAGPPVVDLTDPAFHASGAAAAAFARLRQTDPVAWHPPGAAATRGFWSVTRHPDVLQVCRDTDVFTSVGGNVIETAANGGDPAAGRMLAVSDGQRHLGIRRLLRRSFTPEALRDVEARIRAATRALVRDAVERERCDFASDVAAHIPLAAICDLLGVPPEDRTLILRAASAALASVDPAGTALSARVAKSELLLYFAKLVARKRRVATDDLTSLLAVGAVDGSPLSADDAVLNCYSLVLGGDETTRLSMTSAVLALIENPDQWQALKDGTVSLATATEEVLRWSSAATHVGRTVTRKQSLGGRELPAGDVVVAWLASANFDEQQFVDPFRFDLARTPNPHVSFSYGPHFCIGTHLARVEISALLEALRDEVTTMRLVAPPARIYSNFLQGYGSLRVSLLR